MQRYNVKIGDLVCDCCYNHSKVVEIDGDEVLLENGSRCSITHCLDPADHTYSHPTDAEVRVWRERLQMELDTDSSVV